MSVEREKQIIAYRYSRKKSWHFSAISAILPYMVGLLEPTEVTPTGRRMFDKKSIERIKLIKKLNDSGYPLRAIRELFLEGRSDLKGSEQ